MIDCDIKDTFECQSDVRLLRKSDTLAHCPSCSYLLGPTVAPSSRRVSCKEPDLGIHTTNMASSGKKRAMAPVPGDPTRAASRRYKRIASATLDASAAESAMEVTCRLLGCLPPKVKGSVAVKEDVVERIRSDRFGHFLLTDRQMQSPTTTNTAKAKAMILLSLYGRNYYKDDKKVRVSNTRRLLEETGEPYQRACRLFQLQGDVAKDSLGLPDGLEEFVLNYGTAEDSPGYNIFQGHQIPMCRRVQKSGPCFLHASIVVAAYKAYMCTPDKGDEELPVVDMTKYVHHGFGSNDLTRLLVDASGSSEDHLRKLTVGDRQITELDDCVQLFQPSLEGSSNDACQLITLLKHHGPALVSQFILEPRFSGTTSDADSAVREPKFFDGQNSNNSKDEAARHAMVLVGVRRVQNEWRVLLQNWWPNMPFVEVTAEYLSSSDALLLLMKGKCVQISTQFERCDAVYAEANVEGSDFLDGNERCGRQSGVLLVLEQNVHYNT